MDVEEYKVKINKNIERANHIALSESPHLTEKQRRKAKLYRERQLGKLDALEDLSGKD